MESKEERYDPAVNYDSGSDTELNNAREKYSTSPPSSPREWSVFVYNDTGAGRRGGGPLAEKGDDEKLISTKDAKAQATQEALKCAVEGCKTKNVQKLHKGYAYRCFPCEKEIYCIDCAIGKYKVRGKKTCIHGNLRKRNLRATLEGWKQKLPDGTITQDDIEKAVAVTKS